MRRITHDYEGNLYGVLGVGPRASFQEIHAAYAKFLRNRNDGSSSTSRFDGRFAEVYNAYRILHDSRRRKKYDMFRANRDAFVVCSDGESSACEEEGQMTPRGAKGQRVAPSNSHTNRPVSGPQRIRSASPPRDNDLGVFQSSRKGLIKAPWRPGGPGCQSGPLDISTSSQTPARLKSASTYVAEANAAVTRPGFRSRESSPKVTPKNTPRGCQRSLRPVSGGIQTSSPTHVSKVTTPSSETRLLSEGENAALLMRQPSESIDKLSPVEADDDLLMLTLMNSRGYPHRLGHLREESSPRFGHGDTPPSRFATDSNRSFGFDEELQPMELGMEPLERIQPSGSAILLDGSCARVDDHNQSSSTRDTDGSESLICRDMSASVIEMFQAAMRRNTPSLAPREIWMAPTFESSIQGTPLSSCRTPRESPAASQPSTPGVRMRPLASNGRPQNSPTNCICNVLEQVSCDTEARAKQVAKRAPQVRQKRCLTDVHSKGSMPRGWMLGPRVGHPRSPQRRDGAAPVLLADAVSEIPESLERHTPTPQRSCKLSTSRSIDPSPQPRLQLDSWVVPYRKHLIGIDFDEVLCPYEANFHQWHAQVWPDRSVPDGSAFFESITPLREAYLRSAIAEDPGEVPGAFKGLQRLKTAGHSLVIITSRSQSLRAMTERIVQKQFPGIFDSVFFTDGTSTGVVCKRIGASIMIDDQVDHAIDVAEHGVYAVLFDGGYSWSQSFDDSHPKVVRCNSWSSTVDWILTHIELASLQEARSFQTPIRAPLGGPSF